MKRLQTGTLLLAVFLLLAGCGKAETGKIDSVKKKDFTGGLKAGGNSDVWKTASPETSLFEFGIFDGKTGWAGWNTDSEGIVRELAACKAEPVSDFNPDKVTWPVYGMLVGSTDGMGLRMVWTNGYLITRTGEVYRFPFDFAKLTEKNWENKREIRSVADFTAGWFLVRDHSGWIPGRMTKADVPVPLAGVALSLKEQKEDSLTVTLKNQGKQEWMYGEYFSLEVRLNGEWYRVPEEPSKNYGFNDIAFLLAAGEETEKSYWLGRFGTLPDGLYRIVIEGLSAEFTVGGDAG